ncbi:hypothetical protein NDU88_006612 [Pleurodeles waltl]|uniref:Uncharacterized protein n=1 Tax=Pleurodeles waltl TaxID=8319 RepID=A0AAV7N3J3_PLEWA|nr:hypothetical protein NDU88_006612 [Pleurodeles waltl]
MRGRVPRTKCNPEWLLEVDECKVPFKKVREHIMRKHMAYKQTFDKSRSSPKNVEIHVGSWVKVKKPWRVKKGESQYSEPIQVSKVLRNAVLLSDGKVWNLKRIAMFKGQPDKTVDGSDLLDVVGVRKDNEVGVRKENQMSDNLGKESCMSNNIGDDMHRRSLEQSVEEGVSEEVTECITRDMKECTEFKNRSSSSNVDSKNVETTRIGKRIVSKPKLLNDYIV